MLKNKKVVAIIPARMAASRFPGKPLAPILGLPMIEHVRRRALLSKSLDEVVVATCDQAIMDVVQGFGGSAVMTKDTHQRCTERVSEAMEKINADIVVILQGDEPLFDAAIIDRIIEPFQKDDKVLCTNLLTPISRKEDLNDVDIVKALIDQKGCVLYFSRSSVPHFRTNHPCPVYRQTGLSAFTKDFLNIFSNLSPTPLEITESIDFMRILEHRYPIQAVPYDLASIGVDRPDDVNIITQRLNNDPYQQGIFQRILQMTNKSAVR